MPASVESTGAGGRVLRRIDDPGTGVRWLLVYDPNHPGGPGRIVAAWDGGGLCGRGRPGRNTGDGNVAQPPVIRPGDKLIVEEHRPRADASLEAVAQGSAGVGSYLSVRLKIGGKVVGAVALGPGRAELAGLAEVLR